MPFGTNPVLPQKESLGPLETRLLLAVSKRGSATVRELMDAGEVCAYTTVMTTLDRLYKKGLLERSAEGKAFRYAAKQTQQDFYKSLVKDDLSHLLASAKTPEVPISFLVDQITEHDSALLDELTKAINKKKRELRERGDKK